MSIVLLSLIFAFSISSLINLFFYLLAFIYQTDKFTDWIYSFTFIVLVIFAFLYDDYFHSIHLLPVILLILVLCWATRLGLFLALRIQKIKKDERFDKMRKVWWKFAIFWLIQAGTIAILSWLFIYTFILFSKSQNKNFYINQYNLNYIIYIIFTILAAFFLLFEIISDAQKQIHFKKRTKNIIMMNKLWKYSRHPNYFGEIMFWFMLTILMIASIWNLNNKGPLNLLWILIPIYLSILIIYVSGIKMQETAQWKKYYKSKEFQKYMQITPQLIPFINIKFVKIKKKYQNTISKFKIILSYDKKQK